MEIEGALNYLNRLKRERPYAGEILEIYQSILEFQKVTLREVEEGLKGVNLEPGGAPLIKALREEIPQEELHQRVEKFFKFLLSFGTPKMKELTEVAAKSPAFSRERVRETLISAALSGSGGSGVPWEFLNLVALSILPIFLSPLSKRLQEKLPEDFESVNCPFCGAKPLAGHLSSKEEGRRYLTCPVCYGSWPVKRDRCAGCGREKLEENQYLLPEGPEERHLRVEICNECGAYIKSVDERVGEEALRPPYPLIEDVATPHIDIKLTGEGFKKVRPNLFGF